MAVRTSSFWIAVTVGVISSDVAFADLKEVADGVFVEDFENGRLDEWTVEAKELATSIVSSRTRSCRLKAVSACRQHSA